jgi:hypothetical protein
MILRKIQFLGAFLVIGVGGYSFGFFEKAVEPVKYCQSHFSNAGDIMEYRFNSSSQEYAYRDAKKDYNFDSKDKYGEIILESLIDKAYDKYIPQVSNGYNKAKQSFGKQTYSHCLNTFKELGYDIRVNQGGGVLNTLTNRKNTGV